MAIYVKRVKVNNDRCTGCFFKDPIKLCKADELNNDAVFGNYKSSGYKFWCIDDDDDYKSRVDYIFKTATPEEIKRHLEKSEA